MNPEITVIIPYHNERQNLPFALERVAAQTLRPVEAIFVNSSSTDDSFEIVEKWIKANQTNHKTVFKNLFAHTNTPASSKNAGIKAAHTEWIAFMDCGQKFKENWLESQFNFAQSKKFSVVSGVVYLEGANWIDRCAVAQTYGYKRNRPCVPATLVKKEVFAITGLFLENRRAGYDAAWPIKLRKMGIDRGINEAVKIQYIGTNYSSNLSQLFKKSMLYAKPTVAIEGYNVPYYYVALGFLFLMTLLIDHRISVFCICFYFFLRTIILPTIKSKGVQLFQDHPIESLFGLPITAVVIDSGRFIGILQGIKYYHFSKVV